MVLRTLPPSSKTPTSISSQQGRSSSWREEEEIIGAEEDGPHPAAQIGKELQAPEEEQEAAQRDLLVTRQPFRAWQRSTSCPGSPGSTGTGPGG